MTTYPVNPNIVGVNVIPGSGEFTYDTVAYSGQLPLETGFSPINTYFAPGGTKTDFSYSLDQLQQVLPNCEFVSIVVQLFGNSLDLATCSIYPSTTYWYGTSVGAFEPTAGGSDSWRVSDLTLADCNVGLLPISRSSSGSAVYGGTPSDQSIVRAIQAVKARGLKVALYLLIGMDISGSQPWRGLITHSPDVSSGATSAVASFFGSASASMFTRDATNLTVHYSGSRYDYTYRRFALHYTNLAIVAGGVNLMTIGSELVGLENVRGPAWTEAGTTDGGGHAVWDYPGVAALSQLLTDCRSVLDTAGYTLSLASRQNMLVYSPDWSSWMGAQHAGVSGIFPNLDTLYANSALSAVSIDNYLPLTDWAGPTGGLDAQNWRSPVSTSWPCTSPSTLGIGLASNPSIYDKNYLMWGIQYGERRDYFYSDSTTSLGFDGSGVYTTLPQGDRFSQSRNQYYAGQELFAFKLYDWWWSSTHQAVYDAGDGHGVVPHGPATEWVPYSKSIMFMEYGFGSENRHTNQPNVFFSNTGSSGSAPYWCQWESVNGGSIQPVRDDLLQFTAHSAWYTYWQNPSTNQSHSGVSLFLVDMQFAWNWDARPFPTFPLLSSVWADYVNWSVGMWLCGKGPAVSPPAVDSPPGPGSYPSMPVIAGLGWGTHYEPIMHTTVSTHVSGRETRRAARALAQWDITLSFDRLRSDTVMDLQTLMGFFASLEMMTDSFLMSPPTDVASYASAPLGTGDGSTVSFLVTRAVGSYTDTVQAAASVSQVTVAGVPTSSYTLTSFPLTVTFTTPPAVGAALTISFVLAHLVRLSDPTQDFEEFTSRIWQLGSIKMQTVRA